MKDVAGRTAFVTGGASGIGTLHRFQVQLSDQVTALAQCLHMTGHILDGLERRPFNSQ